MSARGVSFVICLLAWLLPACQTQGPDEPGPVSDSATAESYLSLKPGERPALSSDEAGLWMAVDRMERSLKTSGNRYRDQDLENYVSGIVCRLAGPYCKDIRVYLVRVPYFNASMVPNGAMQVWTGLLLRTRNEAQLAAVLGHEIGHYIRRHSLQRFRDTRDATNGLIFFQIALGVVGIPGAGDIATLIAMASLRSFSRDNEREADEFGAENIAKAGYDPREAAQVWRQLIKEQEADEEGKQRSLIFATHPEPEERIANLDKQAADLVVRYGPGRKAEDSFRKQVGPHRARFLRDELHLRRYKRADKLIEQLLADGHAPGELYFFRGEIKRLEGGKENLEKALSDYALAIETGAFPPVLYKYLGLVHRKLKNTGKARAAFLEYLRRVPEAQDRLIIESMVNQTG